jgi:hypothetical protein
VSVRTEVHHSREVRGMRGVVLCFILFRMFINRASQYSYTEALKGAGYRCQPVTCAGIYINMHKRRAEKLVSWVPKLPFL